MDIITDWFAENQGQFLQYAIDFAIAIAIFIIGKWVAKVVSNTVIKILNTKNVDKAISSFVGSILFSLIFFISIIAAISHMGFDTTSFVAIIGAAGLAVGLALQGSLSNFASGVLLIVLKPFKSGDFVEVAGSAGVVEEIHIFSTQLKSGDNKTLIIPNSAITSGTITNYSTKPTRRIDLIIGVSYDADLAKTKEILSKIANEHELVLKDQAVTVGVSELADSSVNLVLRPWVKSENYWPVYFELLETIKVSLDEAGIEIPYPQMGVHLNKEA